jgi:hypothetical protein
VRAAPQRDRLREGVEDPLRHGAGALRRDVLAQHHELVAAESRDRVRGTDRALQARSDRAQQLVVPDVSTPIIATGAPSTSDR